MQVLVLIHRWPGLQYSLIFRLPISIRGKSLYRAKFLAEEQRIAVRNIKKEARNKAKREDRLKLIDNKLEGLIKNSINEIDAILQSKIDDIEYVDPHWNKKVDR